METLLMALGFFPLVVGLVFLIFAVYWMTKIKDRLKDICDAILSLRRDIGDEASQRRG